MLNRAVVILAVGYTALSRLSKFFLFTSSLWKAMNVNRVWAPSAHGIYNSFGVGFMFSPFFEMCVVLSLLELWVIETLQLVALVLFNLSV